MTERQKKRKQRLIRKRIMTVILALLIIAVLAVGIYFIAKTLVASPQQPTERPTDGPTQPITQPPTDPPTEPPTDPEYDITAVDNNDLHAGYLILVNEEYEYVFPDAAPEKYLINTYDNRSKGKYKFRDDDLLCDAEAWAHLDRLLCDFNEKTGNHNVNIISTFRTFEKQTELFNRKLSQTDYETAKKWVAIPGRSEHHTGFAIDLGIYTDSGHGEDYTGKGEYAWINENCWKYGIILRYPTSKTDITGIGYEPWHFRYTGAPHAEISTKNDLCWEEYIDWIKQYKFEDEHLLFTAFDGAEYEIYFVPVSQEEPATLIYIPLACESYTVQGNNVDGFIVTCKY